MENQLTQEQRNQLLGFMHANINESRTMVIMTMDEKGNTQFTFSGNHIDFIYMHKLADIQLTKIIEASQPKPNNLKPIR